ncbi:Uncharacterized conserved protein, DUF1800 family [Methylomagnum ishizawai]|uniref:Uncharacterized conserved protein, DUF1800 family n=1 Tax=Methylomagnum ishizawai TaxID=1760988 RepID=A0A1Y6CZM4_9GAMM|nr:DUF1800 domain-containing protein [Methylomagnum ishizawai]SMF95766.1 Uncharacterized conserved protein, DUF1800 family [Methylomagnum ishizawai]
MKRGRISASILGLLVLFGQGHCAAAGAEPADCVDPWAPITYPANAAGSNGVTAVEAVRFLNQATFGSTQRDIDHLKHMPLSAWIKEQYGLDASCHLATLNQTQNNSSRENRMEVWWRLAVRAPDQLRQRVAFALSEIFVVSERNSGIPQNALAVYYDVLVRNAFGNFRDILERVTLSPAMGRFLSMLGNQKPDPLLGIRADENYAREVMQLFTIGLVRLDPQGLPMLQDGQPIPTYIQAEVEGLARVFTGWTWGDSLYFTDGDDWRIGMRAFGDYHDRAAKTILDQVRVPARGTAASDLKLALDTIFNHPNVGPFIGRQLIQRLVTSNPSPAYVGRVAAKFNDNGQGVRGDMKAVIEAILLDDEARRGPAANANFGKLREPLLVMAHLWRAFNVALPDGTVPYLYPESSIGQAPLSAPSVFNFFRPDYAPNGAIKNKGLVAPEFQMVTETQSTQLHNELWGRIQWYYSGNPYLDLNNLLVDIEALRVRAAKPATLVDYLDQLLTGRRMPTAVKSSLATYLTKVALGTGASAGTLRALDALYLVISSPYYLIQT